MLKSILIILLSMAGTTCAQPDTLWSKVYEGGLQRDGCLRIIPTYDGGYLLGGYQHTADESDDFVLVKVDSACNQQWRQVYRWEYHDCLNSIAQTPDSCYLMCGYSDVEGSTGVIAKIDSSGELVWTDFYGGHGCYLYDVTVLANGNIVASGKSGGRGYLIELDSEGEVIWQEGYYNGFFKRMLKTNDGGYILAGESSAFGNGNQGYILKADSDGEVIWNLYFGPIEDAIFYSVLLLEDNSYLFAGECYPREANLGRYTEFWLVRTEPDSFDVNDVVLLDPSFPSFYSFEPPYPNPFNSTVNLNFTLPQMSQVSLSIYDLSGREVARLWEQETLAGFYTVNWNADAFPSGTYFAEIATDGRHDRRKLVLLK